MIRDASLKEIPAILGMVRQLHVSTRMALPIDDEVTTRTLWQLIVGERGMVAVSEAGGRLNGFLAASVGYAAISLAPVAQEHGWWGEGGTGLRLLITYERWAKGQGCGFVRMSTPPHNHRAADLLRRRGYLLSELSWVKAI